MSSFIVKSVKTQKGEIKEKLKKEIIDNKITEIKKYDKELIKKIKDNEIDNIDMIKIILANSKSAINQLEKNIFTKLDYIIITILLGRIKGKSFSYEKLEKLTIPELILKIKPIIYDPNFSNKNNLEIEDLDKSTINNKKKICNKNNDLSKEITKVKQYEKSIINDIKSNKLNDIDEITNLLSLSHLAINQLEKGASQLTKVDYIGITILLGRLIGNIFLMKDLERSTISDLIVIIKSIIYDPKIYENSSNNDINNLIFNNNLNIESKKNKIINAIEDNPKKNKNIKLIEDNPKKDRNTKLIEDNPKKDKNIKLIENNPKKDKNTKLIEDNPKKDKNIKLIEDNPKKDKNIKLIEDSTKKDKKKIESQLILYK
jgi:hypothetical protein